MHGVQLIHRFCLAAFVAAPLALPLGCGDSELAARSNACIHTLNRVPALPTSKGIAQHMDLGPSGYCEGDSVVVRFTAEGRSIELPTTSTDPLQVGVPIWIPLDGRLGDVDLDVAIVGPDGTHGLGPLHVPAPPRSDQPAGTVTGSIVSAVQTALAGARRDTAAFANGQVIDAELANLETALATSARAVEDARGGTPQVVARVDGRPVMLDREALAILDGIFLSWLDGRARSTTALGARDLSVRDAPFDDGWFDSMIRDVATGGLESVRSFASATATTVAAIGFVAAVAGSTTAAVPIAVLSAVLFATTTFAPAATALVVGLGARTVSATDPLDPSVWAAVQPPLRHIFDQTLAYLTPGPAETLLPFESEVGRAAAQLIDQITDPLDKVRQRMSDRLFGADAACPDGAIPIEIGFQPDYTLCPKPKDRPPPPSSSGGGGYVYCHNVEGGIPVSDQCEDQPGKGYWVTCDDGSKPPGCVESAGYRANGGILCCSLPLNH